MVVVSHWDLYSQVFVTGTKNFPFCFSILYSVSCYIQYAYWITIVMLSGLGAGFFAVVFGSPIDVVKSRLMVQHFSSFVLRSVCFCYESTICHI